MESKAAGSPVPDPHCPSVVGLEMGRASSSGLVETLNVKAGQDSDQTTQLKEGNHVKLLCSAPETNIILSVNSSSVK